MLKNIKLMLATTALCFAGTQAAVAATADGTTGETSTGTLDVTLVVDKEIKISNLDAIAMGTFAGVDMTGTDDLCIYQNVNQPYQVTITADNGSFQLDDTADANPIPFTVTWDANSVGPAAVTYNTALAGLATGSNTADDDCTTAGADNAVIEVAAAAADITGVPNDTYNVELTILAEPDY